MNEIIEELQDLIDSLSDHSAGESVIDTRDLHNLEDELIEIKAKYDELTDGEKENLPDSLIAEVEDAIEHLEEIEEIKGYAADYQYGETMIHDDYFTEYVEELLVDCGYISRDFPSWIAIDWDKTADNVKEDYTEIEYRGEAYWVRS